MVETPRVYNLPLTAGDRAHQRRMRVGDPTKHERIVKWKRAHPDAIQRTRKRARTESYLTRPFVGVDGEGGTWEPTGTHEYGCISMGAHTLNLRRPLEAADVIPWLVDTAQAHYDGALFVAFYFEYDVTLIMRHLSHRNIDILLDRPVITRDEERPRTQLMWLRFNDEPWKYGIDYIPGKRLRIIRTGKHPRGAYTVTIDDVSSFFATSFVKALERWDVLSADQLAWLASWKDQRGTFTVPVPDEVVEYNVTENAHLSALMVKVRQALEDCPDGGVRLRSWLGAGSIAGALLKKYDMRQYWPDKPAPDDVETAITHAYFGGRFQVATSGAFTDVYEYDIQSAYPAALEVLPCMAHGEWVNEIVPGAYGLRRVWWDVNLHWWSQKDLRKSEKSARFHFGPFPWRSSTGRVYYPHAGHGWYWSPEVDQARMMWPSERKLKILDEWSWVPSCDHKPFAFVRTWFEERQRIGKTNRGHAIKLGLNSLYGKVAQTVGSAEWANYAYAGLITSMTRTRLLQAMCLAPTSTLMMATDGIYTTQPIPLPVSTTLGAWEESKYDELQVLQPGFYWGMKNGKRVIASRGVGARALVACNAFEQIKHSDYIDISARTGNPPDQLITLRLARHLGKLELAGTWQPLDRRFNIHDPLGAGEAGQMDLDLRGYLMSAPYDKMVVKLRTGAPVFGHGNPNGPERDDA